MDGRRFIDSVFASSKVKCITQVVMNLPNDASEYLGIDFSNTHHRHTQSQDMEQYRFFCSIVSLSYPHFGYIYNDGCRCIPRIIW